jgi:hypothetical protein
MVKQATTKSWKKNVLLGVLALWLIGATAAGAVFFKKYQDLKQQPRSAAEVAEAETQRIIQEVSQLYDVPKGEEPSVATVKDKEQLKGQPFFEGAENGDAAVIYTNAKLAILYRPSTKKIIRVSNVSIEAPSPSVVIIGNEADRKAVETSLKALKDEVTIADKHDAENSYKQTIVVDLTGKNGDLVKKLAATLKNAKVDDLPEGEDKPANADIIIIAAPQ